MKKEFYMISKKEADRRISISFNIPETTLRKWRARELDNWRYTLYHYLLKKIILNRIA